MLNCGITFLHWSNAELVVFYEISGDHYYRSVLINKLAVRKPYSNLNMEDITDADSKHAKTVWKDFERKNFGKYHDLPVQNQCVTLLLADVFESFCNKYIGYTNLILLIFFLLLASSLEKDTRWSTVFTRKK